MNTTLIQLVSEQTMQNVVPAIALRPARLIHLVTPKVAPRSGQIAEAVRQAHVRTELDNIHLSQMPTLAETREAIRRAVQEVQKAGELPVVNFTGGTKLMSIGAHQAAAAEQAISIYVDTEFRHFTDGGTGEPLTGLLGADLSFTPFQRAFTVNAIAVANGCVRVTGGKPFKCFQPLAGHLLQMPHEEKQCWEAMYGDSGICPRGREPRFPHDWLAISRKSLSLPPSIVRLALACGLLEGADSTATLACRHRERLDHMAKDPRFRPSPEFFEAIGPLQFAIGFLSGGWWEIAVVTAVEKSGRFRDIRWSVAAGERGFGGSLEEDIVAVDGAQIAYFSCKRGGARSKLTRQLEEMDASARRLGGAFARKFFCVYLPASPAIEKTLRRRADELRIRLLDPKALNNPDCFVP